MSFNENGSTTCGLCNGYNAIEKEIKIYQCCPRCNGFGTLDWVENATRKIKRANMDVKSKIAYNNIHLLMQAIREEGQHIGVDIKVSVERVNLMYDPIENYHTFQPYMIKPYTFNGS
jgi:hypothetical protein